MVRELLKPFPWHRLWPFLYVSFQNRQARPFHATTGEVFWCEKVSRVWTSFLSSSLFDSLDNYFCHFSTVCNTTNALERRPPDLYPHLYHSSWLSVSAGFSAHLQCGGSEQLQTRLLSDVVRLHSAGLFLSTLYHSLSSLGLLKSVLPNLPERLHFWLTSIFDVLWFSALMLMICLPDIWVKLIFTKSSSSQECALVSNFINCNNSKIQYIWAARLCF